MPLNEWLTKVYNIADVCDYLEDAKERIIRDVLISGSSSSHARDKIIRKGPNSTLARIIEILLAEDSMSRSLQNLNSTKSMHYVKYDKKKSGSKGGK